MSLQGEHANWGLKRAVFIVETLLRNGYPREWLALYLQGVNDAVVEHGIKGGY